MNVKAEIQIENKINYILPFYKNPLIQPYLGKCPICGEKVFKNQEYAYLAENTYIHFDCYLILKSFEGLIDRNGCEKIN